jgi:tRNA dimethylallyltransferase
MYLDAVLSGYRLLEAPPNENLRAELDRLSQSELVSRLHGLRDLHNTTDTSDRARLVRAIEIAEHMQNTPDSELRLDLVARVYGLRWDRDRLRRRIVERLNHRLECGLIEEVQGLLGEGLTSQQLEFYGLEYRFVTRYVFGELTRNDMVQKLTSSITQFAKKQETWFRRMERRGLAIRWLDGARPGEELLDEIAADVADPKVSQ